MTQKKLMLNKKVTDMRRITKIKMNGGTQMFTSNIFLEVTHE
jgi:hypothetical protein